MTLTNRDKEREYIFNKAEKECEHEFRIYSKGYKPAQIGDHFKEKPDCFYCIKCLIKKEIRIK